MTAWRNPDAWLFGAVSLVTVAVAGVMLAHYVAAPEALWRDVHHDRNAHLAQGIVYATAFRAFDLVEVVDEILRAVVWPPLHGLVLGLILLPTVDLRLGILPSLAGWSATVIGAAVVARRSFADPWRGTIAGLVAAVFALASPSFRLLGSDVMLEGLGAGLTTIALALYLHAMARPAAVQRWRWLALVLTLLFFEKYNYWGMLVLPLTLAFLAERRTRALRTVRDMLAGWDRRQAWRAAVHDPLVIAGLGVAGLALVIALIQPPPVPVFGRTIALYPPQNLATIAYALLLLRPALLWRRHRAAVAARLGPGLDIVLRWHVAPVALSFVLPKRLAGFLWFLGPSNNPSGAQSDPLAAAAFQWPGFAEGFHVAPWAAILALGLAAVAVSRLHRLAPGARASAVFALVGATAMLVHPHQQWRFETNWMVGVWICAGVGAGVLIGAATDGRSPRVRGVVGALAVGVLALAQALQPLSDMAARVAIRATAGPSDLDFARAYLPAIQGQDPVGFLTTFGRTALPVWTVRADCRCDRRVEAPFDGATREDRRSLAAAWIARTPATRIVTIDAPGVDDMPGVGLTSAVGEGSLEAMATQTRFARVATLPVPSFGATVSIWQRRAGP